MNRKLQWLLENIIIIKTFCSLQDCDNIMTMEYTKILIYNQNKKSILFQQNSILTIFLIKNYIRVPQWNFIFQFQLICNKQDIEYRDTPPTTWNIEILNTFIEIRAYTSRTTSSKQRVELITILGLLFSKRSTNKTHQMCTMKHVNTNYTEIYLIISIRVTNP